MKFFLECVPPTTTAQGKRAVATPSGVRFFKSKQMQSAVEFLTALLCPHRPEEPIKGPVRLEIVAVWPYNKKDQSTKEKRLDCENGGLVWHDIRPDLDNWHKELQDLLVKLRFIEDDSKVVKLVPAKVRGPVPGIVVIIERASLYELAQIRDTIRQVRGRE